MGKPMEQAAEFTGKLDDDHVQLLPKFALKYDFNKQNNIYATVKMCIRDSCYVPPAIPTIRRYKPRMT